MTHLHHAIPRAVIKRERSKVRLKQKRFESLTDSERRLIETPLSRIFDDSRNLIRLTKREHERHHSGTLRLDASRLPLELSDFASDYALEAPLEHELGLLGEAA